MDDSPQEQPAPQFAFPRQTRPRLLLLTQVIVASRMISAAYALYRVITAGQYASADLPWRQLALSALLPMALLVLLGCLSYGLAKVRDWAWHWGLIFAVLLTARFIFVAIRHIEQVSAPANASSAHVFTAILATALLALLLFWYVYEMYSNAQLRAFFKRRA